MGNHLQSVFLNGTVGSGKSATAEALHQLLIDDGISNAVIDLDELRRSWPVPAADRFNHELELRNLQAVAKNYREVGVRRFILAGVLEEPAEVGRYVAALSGGELTVVRLDPPITTIQDRLRNRHEAGSAELSWHLHRSVELNRILDAARLDTYVVPVGEGGPQDVAFSVRALLGW
ncbi:adenylyl-sulfate kinase [Paenarthrobacter sp. Z7-10]|uniref:adenylyl-sulfate kinase n=1 Tax=Paenarthrobacter sp. Z7-10 TaxID=2787635 RepID=UPI0022A8F8EE|nr:adenylyl-sulfate kinase [Paenarthrobacter sp. Z7-10]MCZ2402704.1 adenylyl-sulfate kinase [Paenarthrobacter sp. Z7-10]